MTMPKPDVELMLRAEGGALSNWMENFNIQAGLDTNTNEIKGILDEVNLKSKRIRQAAINGFNTDQMKVDLKDYIGSVEQKFKGEFGRRICDIRKGDLRRKLDAGQKMQADKKVHEILDLLDIKCVSLREDLSVLIEYVMVYTLSDLRHDCEYQSVCQKVCIKES